MPQAAGFQRLRAYVLRQHFNRAIAAPPVRLTARPDGAQHRLDVLDPAALERVEPRQHVADFVDAAAR